MRVKHEQFLLSVYEPAYKAFVRQLLAADKEEIEREAGIQRERFESKWHGATILDGRSIGLVSVEGVLGSFWYGTEYQTIAAQVEALEQDDGITAILLDIDSPGGAVSGCIELSKTLKKCTKPLYAYTEGMATSAAYLIASAADKIFCTAQSETGSIGVIARYLNDAKWMELNGYEEIVFRSKNAKHKALDPTTEEGKQELQKAIDKIETLFVKEVANNRGVTPDDVISTFGQGLTFLGDDALAKGMVDIVVSDFGACVEQITPSLSEGGGVGMGEAMKNSVVLTLDDLKAQHPDLASKLVEEGRVAGLEQGKQEGMTAERNRIVALEKLRTVACGADIVEQAIANGTSVEDVRSAILDKQIEMGGKRTGQAAVSLDGLVSESDSSEANPIAVKTVVSQEKDSVENAVKEAKAVIEAAKHGGSRKE